MAQWFISARFKMYFAFISFLLKIIYLNLVGRFFEENKLKEETKKEMEAMSYGILEL